MAVFAGKSCLTPFADENTIRQLGMTMGTWKANPLDAVPMIIGRNGNPLQMLGSIVASPTLFMGCGVSHHSRCAYGGVP